LISNNPNIETLEISVPEIQGNLIITGTSSGVTTLTVENLSTVAGDISIDDNYFETLSLPDLINLGDGSRGKSKERGSLVISNNQIGEISVPALSSVTDLRIENNNGLSVLSLNALQTINGLVSLIINYGDGGASKNGAISLPFSQINGDLTIFENDGGWLTTLKFPSLTKVMGSIYVQGPLAGLDEIEWDALYYVNVDFEFNDPTAMNWISLPALETVNGTMRMRGLTNISQASNIELPMLTTLSGLTLGDFHENCDTSFIPADLYLNEAALVETTFTYNEIYKQSDLRGFLELDHIDNMLIQNNSEIDEDQAQQFVQDLIDAGVIDSKSDVLIEE